MVKENRHTGARKNEYKVFLGGLILLDFFTLFQIFCLEL